MFMGGFLMVWSIHWPIIQEQETYFSIRPAYTFPIGILLVLSSKNERKMERTDGHGCSCNYCWMLVVCLHLFLPWRCNGISCRQRIRQLVQPQRKTLVLLLGILP